MILQTKRISLVPISGDDIEMVRSWRNSDYVRNNFIFREIISSEDQKKWYQNFIQTGKVIGFIVHYKSLPVGFVYLQNIDEKSSKAEGGFFFSETLPKNQGIGTETYELFLSYVFKELKIKTVRGRVLSHNISSQRIHEKLGFKLIKVSKEKYCFDGKMEDLMEYEKQMAPKKLAIIGANDFQNQLILKAKANGIETHVFAWEDGAVGKENSDFFYPISIVEKEQILEKCLEIKIDGICSIASDLASLTVNYVAEKMGLTGNGIESSLISTNKYLMRKAFEANGDPSPKNFRSDELTPSIIEELSLPLIVKPVDRSGSRGITKIENKDEIKKAIKIAEDLSFDKKAMVEEFIEGKEYSVEFVSYNGIHTFLALTEKFTTGAPHFIETGHVQPAFVSDKVLENVKKVVSHALDTLKIKFGASHSEVMIDSNGNVKIVEIGGRMGGDCIGSDLVYISTGFDFVKMVIDIALGNPPDLSKKCNPRKAEIRFIFSKEDFQILEEEKKNNPEKIYRISHISEISDDHVVEDSSTRYGYYILAG